jgi:quercetin dioxygenase-like cupin family protein
VICYGSEAAEMVDSNDDFRSYPKVITVLPEADIQFEGIKAWILQGETHQLVFFQMEANVWVPEHSHDYPQWGMMVEGEMELTIEGKTRNCRKGDEYLIPARAKHKAHFPKKSRVIDLFSERTRYLAKPVT